MNTLANIFAKQEKNSVQLQFDEGNNFRQFFLDNDALHNLENDLVYTVKQRYTCAIKCKVCFLHDDWLSAEQMKPYTPKEITDDYEETVMSIFERFDRIVSIDDLRDLKNNHPDLFHFYKFHANIMEFHTTDNGFFSQFDLLMNDLHFKEIGQLSFSDFILDKNDGAVVDDVIEKLSKLNDRSPIARLNFVITKPEPENNKNVMKLVNWASKIDNTLAIYFHNDIRNDVDYFEHLRTDLGYLQPSCYYIEHSTQPVTKCNVFSETLHLRYDSFYPDLYSSMDESHPTFYNLSTFNSATLMTKLLHEKVRVYKRNIDIMSEHNKLHDYFEYIVDNLIIHDDFNFVPTFMLDSKSVYYQKLIQDGFVNSYAGLIRPSYEIKPIISWRTV